MTERQPEGPPPWRVAVAFGILGILAIGVCAVSRSPTSSDVAARPPTTPSLATAASAATAAPAPPATSETPQTTPPGTTEAPATTVAEPTVLPGDVFAHTQAALTAWGVFAATYDLAVVEETFVLDGPQYEQLVGEASAQEGEPVGPPPYEFLLAFPQVVATQGNEIVTVRTTVVIAREGDVDREVAWDIEMHWFPEEGRWRLFKATAAPQ